MRIIIITIIGYLNDKHTFRLFDDMSLVHIFQHISRIWLQIRTHFDQYWYFIPYVPKTDYDKIDGRDRRIVFIPLTESALRLDNAVVIHYWMPFT